MGSGTHSEIRKSIVKLHHRWDMTIRTYNLIYPWYTLGEIDEILARMTPWEWMSGLKKREQEQVSTRIVPIFCSSWSTPSNWSYVIVGDRKYCLMPSISRILVQMRWHYIEYQNIKGPYFWLAVSKLRSFEHVIYSLVSLFPLYTRSALEKNMLKSADFMPAKWNQVNLMALNLLKTMVPLLM